MIIISSIVILLIQGYHRRQNNQNSRTISWHSSQIRIPWFPESGGTFKGPCPGMEKEEDRKQKTRERCNYIV